MTETRIALVTGGNRGLGRAIAESLAEEGIDVVLTYRRHREEADKVVSSLRSNGLRAAALQLDMAEPENFSAFGTDLHKTLQAEFGRENIDILVNNAGVAGSTLLGSTDEQTLDELFAVHLKGVYLLTQMLVTTAEGNEPLLSEGGRIINISTGLARFTTQPYAFYAAMKAGVETLTRYWAHELGPRGITVNTVAPGPVATDFADGYLRRSEEVQQTFSTMTALGRVAQPEDIGPVVAALLAPGTAWMTAQRIEASGGFRL